MGLKNRFKFSGFSLMEILIAVSIVVILAIATMPIINRQLSKADEYSYYLAYNTVEKMAGQIVALGDPEDDATSYELPSNVIAKLSKEEQAKKYRTKKNKVSPVSNLMATITNKFTNTQAYILSRFMPRAVAETFYSDYAFGEWESSTYDDLWLGYQVCGNGRSDVFSKSEGSSTETTIDPETGEEIQTTTSTSTHYTREDFQYCNGYTGPTEAEKVILTLANVELLENNSVLTDFYPGEISKICSINKTSIANALKANPTSMTPNAKSFCEGTFRNTCPSSKNIDGITYTRRAASSFYETLDGPQDEIVTDEDDDMDDIGEGEEAVGKPTSDPEGKCVVTYDYSYEINPGDEEQYNVEAPKFEAGWCTANGYFNMTNKGVPYSIDCQCTNSTYEVSTNDEKICVQKCLNAGELPYAVKDASGAYTGNKQCCSTDFNEEAGTCCPVKSLYDASASGTCKCVCASGYKMNSSCTKCELEFCPAGSHKTDDGICVVNPPVTQAKRFCELITEHWNISDSYCGSFDNDVDSQDTYEDVYNAALGNNNKYLSVNSKIGAFKSIKPNIEFANGLKMWILGDKAASIPALTYYNEPVSKTQNMCFKKELTDNTKLGCYYAGGYFCQHENTCLVLDPGSASSGIKDARTCCSAVDYSDLEEEAAAAVPPKNWREDPRAYAIAGFTIFVDINGEKGDGTLWDDVYPFFIGSNGEVYPGYPLDAPKDAASAYDLLYDGGNSEKYLPVDVYYYLPHDEGRQRITAFSSVSFARGVCSARKVSKFSPYCLNLGNKFNGGNGFTAANCPTSGGCTSSKSLLGNEYIQVDDKTSRNPCDHYNCFVAVRKKLKSF